MKLDFNTLGIDIGSTTVKIAILNKDGEIIFSDYQRHYANIQETLAKIIDEAYEEFGDIPVSPMITGSGGLTLSKHMEIPFVQEVVAVATSLKDYAPRTDVAIELGGEDAKIIYFTGGIDQRMPQVLMNTLKIIRLYILSPQDAVYLQKQIFSLL